MKNHLPPSVQLSSLTTDHLNESILSVILSYCNASDLIQILDTKNPILLRAVELSLSNATSLQCSYLLELDRCRNHGGSGSSSKKNVRKEQETCIVRLIECCCQKQKNNNASTTTTATSSTSKLKRIELTGLRHVVGNQGKWLHKVFQGSLSSSLTSIDFSGCAMLDPALVHGALIPSRRGKTTKKHNSDSPVIIAGGAIDSSSSTATFTNSGTTILHINFQGCYRIDAPIVMAIATSERFSQLKSLGLGGCSQTIGDECVHAIITHLKRLRSLDLSGLKRITEQASVLFQFLPAGMVSLELAGCELLRFTNLARWGNNFRRLLQHQQQQHQQHDNNRIEYHNRLSSPDFRKELYPQLMESCPPQARDPLPQLLRINFNGIGTPRRGLVPGALPYFAVRSMGALREVYLSGCEQISDWEVQVLSVVCANSLTCLEMRACCIGDEAVRALGLHCNQLADVDFSACFHVSDKGITAFCEYQGRSSHFASSFPQGDTSPTTKKRRAEISSTPSSNIKSLKIAAIPQLTNDSVQAIAALDSLILLDVSNCPKVTSDALAQTTRHLRSLVELDAKGIGKWSSSSVASSLNSCCGDDDDKEPSRCLRFVNGRRFQKQSKSTKEENQSGEEEEGKCYHRCIAMRQAKRFNPSQGVPLQPMYHCLDCDLTPALNRGMCHACMVHCHKGHRTFTGSFTRFYCDCPFGVAGTNSVCRTTGISCRHLDNTNHHEGKATIDTTRQYT